MPARPVISTRWGSSSTRCWRGVPPFLDETPINVLMKHVNEAPPPVHTLRPDLDIPEEMHDFLQVALRKDPDERFQSVAEFRAALRDALQRCEGCGAPSGVSGFEPTMQAIETRQGIPPFPEVPVPPQAVSGFEPTLVIESPPAAGPADDLEPAVAPPDDDSGPAFPTFRSASWSTLEVSRPRRNTWLAASVLGILGGVVALVLWSPWTAVRTAGPETPPTADSGPETPPTDVLSPVGGPSGADAASTPPPTADSGPETPPTDVLSPEGGPSGADAAPAPAPTADSGPETPPTDVLSPVGGPSGADAAPAPAPTVPVIIDASPDGVRCRWDDEPENAGREVPYLLQLTPEDAGRPLLCSRPGWATARAAIDLEALRDTGKLTLQLRRIRKTPRPDPEPQGPEPVKADPPKGEEPRNDGTIAPRNEDPKSGWGSIRDKMKKKDR